MQFQTEPNKNGGGVMSLHFLIYKLGQVQVQHTDPGVWGIK